MTLSMIKRLGCGKSKSTHVTPALVYYIIMYPYGILEDVLFKVGNLAFPINFVILDMLGYAKTPLILASPFL